MLKTLQPSAVDFIDNICSLENQIFDTVNNGCADYDDENEAYRFRLQELDYDFPKDVEDVETVCTAIASELNSRIEAYDEALKLNAIGNGEDDENDYSRRPSKVWIDDNSLLVVF